MAARFWSPSGVPPWVSPAEPPRKRLCQTVLVCRKNSRAVSHTLAPALGAVSRPAPNVLTRPQFSPPPQQFPSYALGAVSRSVPEMATKSQETHSSLSEFLRHTKGASTVHAQLGLQWLPSSPQSRIRMPPPQEVVAALRSEASRGSHVGHILDLVSMVRVAGSVRESVLS